MARKFRLGRFLLWGFVTTLCLAAAAIGFAYSYVTDSAKLAALIRERAPRFLPGSTLKVDRVQLRPLVGDVELKQVYLWQSIDGADFLAVRIPWLQIRHDFRALLRG